MTAGPARIVRISALGALTALACSAGDARNLGSTKPSGAPGGPIAFEDGGAPGNAPGTVGAVGGVTAGSACATAAAGATRPPAHLVFMYDRSFSMGFTIGGAGGMSVWDACKAGLTGFFASSSSAGLRASLAFFGRDDTLDSVTTCSAGSYATPDVAMTSLPNATAFSQAINATKPFTGTPTLPALQGAIAHAKAIKAKVGANERVSVVLVTDGTPTGCTDNTLDAVHDAAAAAAALGIATYVVGIGTVQNMQTIASGGGTTAIQVSAASPSQVESDLEAALGQIGASALGCEFALPPPPAGQALDVNAVNVNYTPSGGAASTLLYSGDCSDGKGWRYDSVTAPTKILFCPAMCKTLEADRGGKMDVIFGCTTELPAGGAPPK